MIERMGAKFADNLDSPRILKTHFSWYNLPKSTQAKYIFVVRNPKDCLIRYRALYYWLYYFTSIKEIAKKIRFIFFEIIEYLEVEIFLKINLFQLLPS